MALQSNTGEQFPVPEELQGVERTVVSLDSLTYDDRRAVFQDEIAGADQLLLQRLQRSFRHADVTGIVSRVANGMPVQIRQTEGGEEARG